MLRSTLLVVLAGCVFSLACSAEADDGWWPFDGDEAAPATQSPFDAPASQASPAPAPAQQAAPAEPERRWMIESPLTKVSWPRLHLPSLPKPHLPPMWVETQDEPPKNTWMDRQPQQLEPSPWQSLSTGARRVGERTRLAWDKTIDVLTPGGGRSESDQFAQRENRPSFWSRMFGSDDSQEQGAQTVTEWLAQDRVDP